MAEDLLSTYEDSGYFVDTGSQSAEFSGAGSPDLSNSSPSLWDKIVAGSSSAVSTGKDAIGNALSAAKSQLLSDTSKKLAARPDVQAAAKSAAGNKIGAWMMDYWKEIALAALVLLFALVRSGVLSKGR